MKNLLILLFLLVSISYSFAQTGIELSMASTLSPFVTATKVIESGIVTSLAPFATTMGTIQARGVAGKEQLRDELSALNEDIIEGKVRNISEVKQVALKELFLEIENDEEQMKKISMLGQEGNKLNQIATAVTLLLMAN